MSGLPCSRAATVLLVTSWASCALRGPCCGMSERLCARSARGGACQLHRLAAQLPSRGVASAAVALMGLAWASVGGALLLATEYLESSAAKCVCSANPACCLLGKQTAFTLLPRQKCVGPACRACASRAEAALRGDTNGRAGTGSVQCCQLMMLRSRPGPWRRRQAYFVLSGVCVLVGATTTHGLAGELRHAPARGPDGSDSPGWQFFQPFRCEHRPSQSGASMERAFEVKSKCGLPGHGMRCCLCNGSDSLC